MRSDPPQTDPQPISGDFRIPVVVNPAANGGRASKLIGPISAAFQNRRADIEVHAPKTLGATEALLGRLADSGAARIIVVGGDGMVHLAVNALATTSTILGIVPGGTGNDCATGLGLPAKLDAAVTSALGPATSCDVIKTGDRYALSVATLGFSVAVNARADAMRFPRGGSKYTLASLAELPRLAPHEIALTLDGERVEVGANLLAVANTPMFGGGMKVAPDADPHDGLLDIVVIGPASRSAFVRVLPRVFSGSHVTDQRVAVHRCEAVRIEGPPLEVRADGEILGNLPLEIGLVAEGIRIAGVGST